MIPTLDVGGNKVQNTITNGYIWTPRAEKLNGIDLTGENKITEFPGFDFEVFKDHEAVIGFRNGYGINLYGARIQTKEVLASGAKGTYLTKDGKKLYGRLVCEKTVNGRRVLEEILVKPEEQN